MKQIEKEIITDGTFVNILSKLDYKLKIVNKEV